MVGQAKTDTIKHVDPHIDIDAAFLHETTRKVHNDSIVSVNGIAFEAPSVLMGKKVHIRFDPHPPIKRLIITYNGKNYGEARPTTQLLIINTTYNTGLLSGRTRPVDLYANTKVKRSSFSRNLEITAEIPETPEDTGAKNQFHERGLL